MTFFAHRINTPSEVRALPLNIGFECDVREGVEDSLSVQHDWLSNDPLYAFHNFINEIDSANRPLIVNVKAEGIEEEILATLKNYKGDFFLLDCSFPMIRKMSKKGETRTAIRFSEFESIETAIALARVPNQPQWIWVDCFESFPLTKEIETILHASQYKLCIVSPELQGRPEDIDKYIEYIQQHHIHIDAVCSKVYNYDKWSPVLAFSLSQLRSAEQS